MIKKFFLLFMIAIGMAGLLSAQSGGTATINPAAFTAEDEITIRVNISNVGNLAGSNDIYLWAWSNAGDALNNGTWGSSSEAQKMTKVGTDLFEIKLTPTTFYGKSPSELKWIGFLVKAKDGNGDRKSSDFTPNNVDPLVFVPSQFRTFPAKVGPNDVITIYFDQTLATEEGVKRLNPTGLSITAHEANGTQIDVEKTGIPIKSEGKVFSAYLIPNRLFTVPAGKKIALLRYRFTGTTPDANGNPVAASSNQGEITLFDF